MITTAELISAHGERRIREWSDDNGVGSIDETVVNNAINYAYGEYKSYLPLPDPETDFVRAQLVILAGWRLACRRSAEGIELLRMQYEDVLTALKMARKNQIDAKPETEGAALEAAAESDEATVWPM